MSKSPVFVPPACIVCRINEATHMATVDGMYYPKLCSGCLTKLRGDSSFSYGAQSHERRRGYEDMAQDAVQPYNAKGPNSEFYRLYPRQAEKIFTKDEIEQVKRQL